MRVLGIDPSLKSTGFGVIEYIENSYIPVVYGVIKPSPKLPFACRLNEIKSEIEKIIVSFSPEDVAIENAFYAQNVRTALSLGQVRGAVLVAVASQKLPLFEYSALEIKKAVTGYGQAAKDQVLVMIKTILRVEDDALSLDASDALAVALCHIHIRTYQKNLDASKI